MVARIIRGSIKRMFDPRFPQLNAVIRLQLAALPLLDPDRALKERVRILFASDPRITYLTFHLPDRAPETFQFQEASCFEATRRDGTPCKGSPGLDVLHLVGFV